MRCVQLLLRSKPGGVMSPPELIELTSCLYSSKMHIASEELEKQKIHGLRVCIVYGVAYLMKRVSRSWSRLTKDFMVRKRLKRSWISRFWKTFCAGQSGGVESTWSVFESATR